MAIEVAGRFTIPDTELSWRFQPSGGPGGQHANRSHTRAELTWRLVDSSVVPPESRSRLLSKLGPTVVVVADDERSQLRNRSVAEERLVRRIVDALAVPKQRRRTRPSAGSKRRRLDSKSRNARTKQLRRRPSRDD
jgi:ribosome-associated protein